MDYDIYIYIIFLYGSILLILSICKKLYISLSLIYHRPFWLKQSQSYSALQKLNSMPPAVKVDPVLCHDISRFAVCKQFEEEAAGGAISMLAAGLLLDWSEGVLSASKLQRYLSLVYFFSSIFKRISVC